MGVARQEVGIVDSLEGVAVIPVVVGKHKSLQSDVPTAEAKVVAGDATIALKEFSETSSNGVVKANTATRDTSQVALEVAQAAVELLPGNNLGLDVANILDDDPLSQFAENNKTLLNNLNSAGTADEFTFFHDDLLETTAIKVVDAVEVIKVVEGVEVPPAVEGDMRRPRSHVTATSDSLSIWLASQGACPSASSEQRSNDSGFVEEHDELKLRKNLACKEGLPLR